jgi:hypothetical protein
VLKKLGQPPTAKRFSLRLKKINVLEGVAKMKFSFQIPNFYIRLGDFTGLTRYGYPFGGPSPDELSLETFQKVNARWEEFYNTAYSSLLYFARNDEDLVQHGMLAVRGKLCQNPDAPISHLMTCAKGEILTAIRGNEREAAIRYDKLELLDRKILHCLLILWCNI